MKRSKARDPVRRASAAAPPTAASIAAHWLEVLESIQIGDVRAREDILELAGEGPGRVERAQPLTGPRVHVDAAVLLRGTGDRAQAAPVDVGVAHEVGHDPVERFGPHERRRMHGPRIGRAQDTVLGSVAGERVVVAERPLEEDRAPIGIRVVDVDGRRRHALRAGVETKVNGHGYCGTSQRPVSADLKMASMHAMLFTASSRGKGTSWLSRIALEKRSPWIVYWLQTSMSM